MTDADHLRELAKFAERLADAAGDVIREATRKPFEFEMKGDGSPVSEVDKAAEDRIRSMIADSYPDHGILGEEFGEKEATGDFTWVLDPIDGTKSFIAGRPIFGTLIALVRNGDPILGVIDQPISEERWVGAAGHTTTINGDPIATRPCGGLGDAVASTTTPDMFTGTDLAKYDSLKEAVWHMQFGGDCYSYGTLAMGFVDVIIEADLKPYDFCALAPVVNGAGGMMTDWQGAPLHMNSDGRVAAVGDPSLLPAVINLLKD